MMQYLNKKLILAAIIAVGVLAAGAFLYINQNGGNALSAQAAAEKAMAFINQSIQDQNVTASLMNVAEESGVYKIHLKIEETEYDSYITKDGKFLFASGFNLEGQPQKAATPTEAASSTTANLDSFAQCLTEKGAKFYGAWWCPHCQNQKKTFGDSLQYVNYIECEQTPGTSQGSMTDVCKAAKIESFPTWDFADGTRKTGEITLENLSEISGCPIQ